MTPSKEVQEQMRNGVIDIHQLGKSYKAISKGQVSLANYPQME